VRRPARAVARAACAAAVAVAAASSAGRHVGPGGGGPDGAEGAGHERASAGRPRPGFAERWTGPRTDLERTFGRSAEGGKLLVTAFGAPRARRRVLVFGCIHGTECAGIAVARRLPAGCPPTRADVWIVPDLNPDGRRLGVRVNGRGVDLNRNFAAGWRPIGARGDPQHSGPRPFSEPETRAARDLIRRLRPAVTIWYHQGEGPYVRAWGQSIPAARRYARASGLPFRALPWPAGTAPHWQNRSFPGTSSFVVELPAGSLSKAGARRHAAAVERNAGYRGANRLGVRGSHLEGD
jgi:protein MpaA